MTQSIVETAVRLAAVGQNVQCPAAPEFRDTFSQKKHPCLQVTHMPPELLRDGQLSKAVDVYAFGVLLWEMCVSSTSYVPPCAGVNNLWRPHVTTWLPLHSMSPAMLCLLCKCLRPPAQKPALFVRRYVGERPWAGMRPVTIILKKTQVP